VTEEQAVRALTSLTNIRALVAQANTFVGGWEPAYGSRDAFGLRLCSTHDPHDPLSQAFVYFDTYLETLNLDFIPHRDAPLPYPGVPVPTPTTLAAWVEFLEEVKRALLTRPRNNKPFVRRDSEPR